VSRVRADAVLVLPGVDVTGTEVRDLTWLFEDSPVTVGIVCPVSSVSAHRLRTTKSGPTTVLELGKPRATAGARLTKALVDRSGAVVLLLATSPLLLLLWAAVRLDSTGPGLYVATRTGRDGERFQMVKLRTMHHDAGDLPDMLAAEDEAFSISRDPRVTRVGYWLRRFSLDELPQLFNVLRGEMSLVGPRPALPDEVAEYDSVSRRRLVVKPGITGLWQLSGHRNLLWDESLRLDLYYADNWRLVDDLRIAARSVVRGTRARGAY
jgi:lipopolysaccharide/colanic/teichoic acid biosynthesis glycosyltransferase